MDALKRSFKGGTAGTDQMEPATSVEGMKKLFFLLILGALVAIAAKKLKETAG